MAAAPANTVLRIRSWSSPIAWLRGGRTRAGSAGFSGAPRCPRIAGRWPRPTLSPDLQRALELLDTAHRPSAGARVERGYLDLLGDEDPTGAHPGQRLMASDVLPLVYERVWRPIGGRLFMGLMGPGMRGEHRIALEMLELSAGDRVLDVACGPGNFTREFAAVTGGSGLVVGLDASRTMLDRAVQEPNPAGVAYVRGDASALPFRDGAFDAVCCFAALYLIERPFRTIAEIARVLAPGGRVALLSSVNRGIAADRCDQCVRARLQRRQGVRAPRPDRGARVPGPGRCRAAARGLRPVRVGAQAGGLSATAALRPRSGAAPRRRR